MTLLQHEPRVPDGTRPLEVGRPVPFLEPQLAVEELACFYAGHAEQHRLPLPEHCRRVIAAGEHFLSHIQRDWRDEPTGERLSYCAPCAVRFAAAWDVREATA